MNLIVNRVLQGSRIGKKTFRDVLPAGAVDGDSAAVAAVAAGGEACVQIPTAFFGFTNQG